MKSIKRATVLGPWIPLLLSLALGLQACIVRGQSSRDFIASLEGELVFYDVSRTNWRVLDFSGGTVRSKLIGRISQGVVSPDGEWQLLFIEETDTNGDGVVDESDQSSVYLSRMEGAEKRRVNLPFPVYVCAWRPESMVAACSFDVRDVNPDSALETMDNRVYYLVSLESGELLQRLSDPYRTSWSLRWSPDGSMVALQVGTREGDQLIEEGLQVIEVASGELLYEFSEPVLGAASVWSPDSTRLAFVTALGSGRYSGALIERMYCDVFYVDLRDERPTPVNVTGTSRFSEIPAVLTHLGGIWVSEPVWSPDGQAIASVWKRDNREQIWITRVEGSDWARVTRGLGRRYSLIEWRP